MRIRGGRRACRVWLAVSEGASGQVWAEGGSCGLLQGGCSSLYCCPAPLCVCGRVGVAGCDWVYLCASSPGGITSHHRTRRQEATKNQQLKTTSAV